MTTKLQVVIPCFNEAGNLASLIQNCESIYVQSERNISFILVNNGSVDESAEILESKKYDNGAIHSVSVDPNRGYGGGILAGLSETTSEYVGWTHADLQTPLSDILKAYKFLSSQDVFVKGARKKRPIVDQLFTLGMSGFESLLFRKVLTEINAQPTVFHRSNLQNWTTPPADFSLDLYALVSAKQKRLSIIRFPVAFEKRSNGKSSWNTGFRSRIKFIKRTVTYSLKLKRENNAHN